MNCNGNTYPLTMIDNDDNCNSICSNVPINIICRKMILNNAQQFLAVQNESNFMTKVFILPATINNEDFTTKTFYIETKDSANNVTKTEITNLEITENTIKLNWVITKDITKNSGTIQVQIDAEEDGFLWNTIPQNFYIVESINASTNS